MRVRWTAALALVAATVAGQPAGASDGSLTIGSVTSGAGGAVTVRGVLTLPTAASAPVTVSTDAAGDSRVLGTDLRDTTATLTGWPSRPVVEVTTALAAGGTPPAHGFAVPVDVGDGRTLFLGAGTPGSNLVQTSNWVALCTVTTGWSCPLGLEGGLTASGATWRLPLGDTVKGGTVLNAGSAYRGVPSSFAWPSAYILASQAPHDTATPLSGYVVPGGVEAAVLPTAEGQPFEWSTPVAARPSTGAYTVTVPVPSGTGPLTLWVRSCWGSAFDPQCVVTSQAL